MNIKIIIYFLIILNYTSGYKTKCDKTTLIGNSEIYNVNDDEYKFLKNIQYNIKEIKLSKTKNTACFYDNESKTEIVLKYISNVEKCEQMKTLYYIPKNPSIICKNTKKTNTGNKQFYPCKEDRNETLHTYFADVINDSKIIIKGCQNQYSSLVNGAMWWIVVLRNPGNSAYKVKKCFNSYYETKLRMFVYRNNTLTTNKIYTLTNSIVHNEDNFQIYIEKMFSSLNLNNFINKCFIEDLDIPDKVSVVNNCNDENSLSSGVVGEIKCPDEQSARYGSNKCHIAAGLFYPLFDNYDLKNCIFQNLNYDQIINYNILPVLRYSSIINYTLLNNMNEKAYTIKHIDSNVILNFQTNLGIMSKINIVKCDIINNKVIKLDTKYIYQTKEAEFNINVKSNFNSTVSLQCEDPDLRIPPVIHVGKYEFYETTLKFLPTKSRYDTYCDILCDDEIEIQHVKFIADFVIVDNNTNNVYINEENAINSNSDDDKSFGNEIVEFFTDIYNNITNYIMKYIILIIIICILLLAFILQRFFGINIFKCILSCFKCFKQCCKCCKKKYKKTTTYINDEENNVELIEMTKPLTNKNIKHSNEKSNNKFDIKKIIYSNNTFYTYNNETIKIYNSIYKIKPDGVFLNNKKIIDSIPKLIFYNNNYEYNYILNNIINRDTDIILAENCLNPNIKLYENCILKNNVIYYNSEPIVMLKKNMSKNITIKDKEYKNINNSLYRNDILIISNFFIDF